MMPQISAVARDEQTIAQAELEQYITQQANYLAPEEGKGFSLEVATQDILSYANFMATKKTRDKTEFKQLLNDLGWKGEEKRYLKVAAAFENFSPQDLSQIEPATIFLLANNSKKYQPVIDELLNLPEITQAAVRELIQQQRQPRVPKSENPTIWRQTPDGRRYCQIPPIHEENQQTGITLQKMMDEEGLTSQRIVAEALALRQAFKEGRLVAVEAAALPKEMPTFVESVVQHEDLLTELLDEAYAIPDLAAEQCSVEELESVEQCVGDRAQPWTSEPEQELNNDTVELGDYAVATVAEEILSERSPIELLIHTFQTAAHWSEISSVLNIHSEYESSAWEALTPLERRRVMEITPPEIKKLNKAKKSGMIVDFREVCTDMYQVQRQGSPFKKMLRKSDLDTFLAQL